MDGGERPPAAWGPWKHTNTVINFYQGIMIFVGVVSNIATVWWTYRALRFFSRSGERICDELEKLYWYLVGHLFLWGIRSVQHRFQHWCPCRSKRTLHAIKALYLAFYAVYVIYGFYYLNHVEDWRESLKQNLDEQLLLDASDRACD